MRIPGAEPGLRHRRQIVGLQPAISKLCLLIIILISIILIFIISIILIPILFTCDGFCWIVGWLAIRDQIQVAAEANQIINIIIFSTYIIIKNIAIIICIFTILIIIFSIYIVIGTCVICIAIMISRIRNLCGYRYWSNWTEQPAYCKRCWWRWWSNNITATAIPLNSL